MKLQSAGLYLLVLLALTFSCKRKGKENEGSKKYVSILSLIKAQVADVDSSLYSITKITCTDSLDCDTVYLRREEFREAAKEFLDIPDLSNSKVARKFREEPAIYDEALNRAIITYTPLDPDKEEIKKQELLVTPNAATGDKVNTIIITRVVNNRDGYLRKEMLWQIDKSFQVVTSTQRPGEPEQTVTVKVAWNEDEEQ